MSLDIKNIYAQICAGDLVVSHYGEITPELISDVLAKVEGLLDKECTNAKVIRKVYNVLVEALQNLYHHLEIPPEDFIEKNKYKPKEKFAIFSMKRLGDNKYKISTGNFVHNKDVRFLRDRISQLNALSPEELKELFKTVLNNNEFSAKGGGGLGFIEMARKSQNKFGFDFPKYDDEYSFFVFDVFC